MTDRQQIGVVLTATDSTAQGTKSATTNLQQVGQAGVQASQELNLAGAAFLQTLERQSEALGKTRAQIMEFKAQQLGVAQAAAPLIEKFKATEQVVAKTGVSAAQTAQAMKQLPAQLTDIATQLAGGQSPFLILLEQGGQIKDSFGGIGNTLKSLASLLTPARIAIAGVAGAVVALAVAYSQGAKEAKAFNEALILTGGYAGKSTSDLIDMSAAIGRSNGNQALAAEVLAKLVSSGKVAGDAMQSVGTAIVAMSRATGASVDDLVKSFTKLADEPAKASAQLNDQFHYLTASIYEQIAALEEAGKKNEAAALAEKTYADAMRDRAANLTQNLGLLERAWVGVQQKAREAWNSMLDIGRQQSTTEKIADIRKQLEDRQARGPINSTTQGAFDKGNQRLRDQLSILESTNIEERKFAEKRGEYLQTQQASIAAQDRIRKTIEDSASKQEKMNKALADARRDFDAIRKADPNSALLAKEQQTYADIRDKYADKSSPKAYQDDAATKMLERLREQNAALQEQLQTDEKLTGAEAERAKFNQQISELKGKTQLTAEQKSLLAAQDAIRAQLEINIASEKAVELKKQQAEEEEKHKKLVEEVRQLTEATNLRIESSTKNRQDQYDRQLSVIGLGAQAAQELQSTQQIYREFLSIQDEYTRTMAKKGMLGSDEYVAEVARIKAALQDNLDANANYWKQLRDKQSDWVNGATAALQDYVDQVNNAMKRAGDLMTQSLNGITDGITGLLTGDKGASFKETGAQIIKQITRGIVEQQITKPIAEWAQGQVADSGSILSKLFGGLTSNKETGESWLGFLGLGGKGGSTAAKQGATAANPLYVRSVDALTGGAAGGGGSSGGLGSLFGGLFSNSTATSMANKMPGDPLDNLIGLTGGWGTVPSFAVGTDFVPRDMFARIHKGERIVPAAQNSGSGARRGGGSTYNISVPVYGRVDNRTRNQIANDMAMAQRRAERYA